jgi:hypothetical protein
MNLVIANLLDGGEETHNYSVEPMPTAIEIRVRRDVRSVATPRELILDGAMQSSRFGGSPHKTSTSRGE